MKISFLIFSAVRERAVFYKSSNLIGSESGQYSSHTARSQRAVSDPLFWIFLGSLLNHLLISLLCFVYPRPRAQFFPIRTDLGWWITHIYIFFDHTRLFWLNARCHLQGLNKLFLHLMRALLLHNNDRLSRIFSCMLLIRNHIIFLVQFEINCVNWFPFHLYLKRCLLLNYIIDEPAALISPFPKIFLRTDINECPPFLPVQTQRHSRTNALTLFT